MASRSVPRGKRGWRRLDADPARLGPVLRESGVVTWNDDPSAGTVWMDRAGRMRRITASYPDGWRCYVTLHLDGTTSVTKSMSLRVEGWRPDA